MRNKKNGTKKKKENVPFAAEPKNIGKEKYYRFCTFKLILNNYNTFRFKEWTRCFDLWQILDASIKILLNKEKEKLKVRIHYF